MDIWVQLGKGTFFSHMAFSLMASNKNGIDYIFVPNIPHIFGIEFFVFFHFHIGKPLTSSSHVFTNLESTNFFHKLFSVFFKGLPSVCFVKINSYISSFDLNRKLLHCRKTNEISLKEFVDSYFQNSWKHVMSLYLVPICYGPLNFGIKGQFFW